jgi:cytochrome c oxidase subunit 2
MRIFGRRSPARVASALVLVALVSLLSFDVAFAGGGGQPSGITDQARDMHRLYLIVLAIAVVVFVAVEGALLFIILRFRRRNDELPPQIHGSNLLEVIWTTIPVVIVVVLFVLSFIVLVDVEEEANEEALTINVTGFQFSWEFVYNTNDLGVGTDRTAENQEISVIGTGLEEPVLVIPVDEPVEFKLAAADVIHAFYVADFLYKLDLIPGRDNKFQVTARELGTYNGQCAELCGLNHALMRFQLRVVTREEFDRWIEEQLADERAARQP